MTVWEAVHYLIENSSMYTEGNVLVNITWLESVNDFKNERGESEQNLKEQITKMKIQTT